MLVSPLMRGVLPRFIYSGKSGADAGIDFGSRIWAFDDPTTRESSGASIAPSMPGDLYDAGGVLYIALGALIFGSACWAWWMDGNRICRLSASAAITVLVATQCAMSVERDFDNSIATFIQTLLVFVLVSGLVAMARRSGGRTILSGSIPVWSAPRDLMTPFWPPPPVPRSLTNCNAAPRPLRRQEDLA